MTSRTPTLGQAATLVCALTLSLGVLSSCSDSVGSDASRQPAPGVTPAPGFTASVLFETEGRPTQLVLVEQDHYLIAEFTGGENDQQGSVTAVRIENDQASQTEIYGDLDKPTGIAMANGDLYIMERRQLSRGKLNGSGRTIVQEDMPFNGRSQGTLTPDPAGSLFFNTSGDIDDGSVVAGSGILWTLDTERPESEPAPYATGFKNAYAHHLDDQGRVWVAEVNDGTFDGEPGKDEVVLASMGADGGWPRCVDNGRPVVEFGGSETVCSNVTAPHTVFDTGATPTSITTSPWDDNTLLVALWGQGRVVGVDKTNPDREPIEIVTGIERPQHLLADGDRLLIVDHTDQRVLAVEKS